MLDENILADEGERLLVRVVPKALLAIFKLRQNGPDGAVAADALAMTDVAAHVWATVEIRHANHGWHPGLVAHLIDVSPRQFGMRKDWRGSFFCWKLQGKTAGVSVDRALNNVKFRSVPIALEWVDKHKKFTRNLVVIREWKDACEFYFEGPAGKGELPVE